MLAVDLMHRKEILHRDIKPENILILDKDSLKVCFADLGFACSLKDHQAIEIKCGTPGYVDPDILNGNYFSTKSDIFSLGSLLFNLITRKFLFKGKVEGEILRNNRRVNPQLFIEKECIRVSEQCRSLLKLMLSPTQIGRPTAEQCLKHEWFG